MKLVAVPNPIFPRFAALLAEGMFEYSGLPDSTLELGGERVDPRPVLMTLLRSGNSQLLLMIEEDAVVGYDIVSFTPEFVIGHQTWIRPEKRRQGLWRKYLAEIRELGKSLGCRQFRFTSTLEEWNNRAPKLGLRRIEWKSGNGVTATTWGVEV